MRQEVNVRRSSLNHFIRAQPQRLRNRETERFGSLEVDAQLEFGRLLDGQVGGFGTLEDLVDVLGGDLGVLDCYTMRSGARAA